MQYKWYTFRDFSKGINQAVSDPLLEDNETPWQRNVYLGLRHQGYGGLGALQKRPGSTFYPVGLSDMDYFNPLDDPEEEKSHGISFYAMENVNKKRVDFGFSAIGQTLGYNSLGDEDIPPWMREAWVTLGVVGGDALDFNPNENRVEFETIKNFLVSATGNNLFYLDPSRYEDFKLTPIVLDPPPYVSNGTSEGLFGLWSPGFGLDIGTYRYRLSFLDIGTGFLTTPSPYVEVVVSSTQNAISFNVVGPNNVFPQPDRSGCAHILFRTKVNQTSTYYFHPDFSGLELMIGNRYLDIYRDGGHDYYSALTELMPVEEGVFAHPAANANTPLAYSDRLFWISGSDEWYSERGKPFTFYFEGTANFIRVTSLGNDLLTHVATRNGILALSRSSAHLLQVDPFNLRLINDSVGVASKYAKASDGNSAYFLSSENKIYVSDGITIQSISDLIENELKHLNVEIWDDVAMAIYDDLLWIAFKSTNDQFVNDKLFVYNIRTKNWTEYTGLYPKHLFSTAKLLRTRMFIVSGDKTSKRLHESEKNSPPYDGDPSRVVLMSRITKYTDLGLPDYDKRLRTLRIKALCYTLTQNEQDFAMNKYILENETVTFPLEIRIYVDYQDSEFNDAHWQTQIQISSDQTTYEVPIPQTVTGRTFKFDISEGGITDANVYMAITELSVRFMYNEEKYAT